MSLRNAVGVDIGGGSIKVSLFDETGKELKTRVSPTPEHLDNHSFLEILKETIRPLVSNAIGIGVGGGFVDKGILYSGYLGNGIEIGHTTSVIGGALCGCGVYGCVESYFSTRGFLNRYTEKTKSQLENAETFFRLVREKNPIAEEILHFGTLALAHAVRGAIHLLNPEAVVFVGGITKSYDLFGKILESEIRSNIFPVLNDRLKIGSGGSLSGALGAASLVFSKEKV